MSRQERPPRELNVDTSMGTGVEEELPEVQEALFKDVLDPDAQAMLRGSGDDFGDELPEVSEAAKTAKPSMKRIQLRTGQVYTGRDETELLQKFIEAQENATLTIQERESQIRELRGKSRQQTHQEQVTSGEQWDPQRYLDLLGQDPMKARRYQDRFYLGLEEGDDPGEMMRFAYSVSDQVSDKIAIGEFLQYNEDFPANANNAQILLSRLDREGLELNSRNLSSVFNEMKREGVFHEEQAPGVEYEDLTFSNIPAPDKNNKNFRPRRAAAPAPSGGGGGDMMSSLDFDGMSDAELEKEIQRRGMKKF